MTDVRDIAGESVGEIDLDDSFFGIQPNVPVMHQVVTAQLAARRAGTQSTKTRAEVAGGGAKPWRQKGTGRARQGSKNAPHWRGGGVALGPKPRSYAQRTPKKMIRLALRSALSDRAAAGKVVVVDEWSFDGPKTKDARKALDALGLDGRVLVVLSAGQLDAWKSFRNLTTVHPLLDTELNAYDVLCSDWVVFTKDTVPTTKPAEGEAAVATPAKRPAKKSAAKTAEPAPEAAEAPAGAASETDGIAEGGAGEAKPSGASDGPDVENEVSEPQDDETDTS
jgi:large subunit ribosomal protein L4